MRRELFICCLFCLSLLTLSAQEIPMQEVAALEQVYGDVQESEGLLPMNELGIEFGYALYEAEITVEGVAPILAVENILGTMPQSMLMEDYKAGSLIIRRILS